jgi:hypothetical protein
MPATLKNVSSRYGAPMGRMGAKGDPDWPYRFNLSRLRLNSVGYDAGGAYWGLGQPLYWASALSGDAGVSDVEVFFRAKDREAAKAFILEEYPEAKFHR